MIIYLTKDVERKVIKNKHRLAQTLGFLQSPGGKKGILFGVSAWGDEASLLATAKSGDRVEFDPEESQFYSEEYDGSYYSKITLRGKFRVIPKLAVDDVPLDDWVNGGDIESAGVGSHPNGVSQRIPF